MSEGCILLARKRKLREDIHDTISGKLPNVLASSYGNSQVSFPFRKATLLNLSRFLLWNKVNLIFRSRKMEKELVI